MAEPGQVLTEPLLRAVEVAELLGIPSSTVYGYARRRTDPMPSVRVGKHLRFERGAVEGWLAARRRGGR